MRFKIKKSALTSALSLFKGDDEHFAEIELTPIVDTATQAIYEQNIRNQASKAGIEHGYKEGFYHGMCPEKKSRYSCCHCHCH